MNLMTSSIIVAEKELELERQGFRRTRRWIGDANQVADEGWYRPIVRRIPESNEARRVGQKGSRWETLSSELARLLHVPRTRQQTACNEC